MVTFTDIDKERAENGDKALAHHLATINANRAGFFKREPLTIENDKGAILKCLYLRVENLERTDVRYSVRSLFAAIDYLEGVK